MEKNIPSGYLLDCIEEANKERRNKDYYSFKSNQEALDFLEDN
jgi:hypothetical protein